MKRWYRVNSLSKHLHLWRQAVEDLSYLEFCRSRAFVVTAAFCLIFVIISLRLVDVMLCRSTSALKTDKEGIVQSFEELRADILDRNGEILATNLVTASIYANPKMVLNAEETASKLSSLLDISYESLLKKLKSNRGFVWIARHVPPKLQYAINYLGLPGIYLHKDYRRVYPFGSLASHVVGYCDIDNNGLAGIEKYFDATLLSSNDPIVLSLDIRLQHILYDELLASISEFQAEGGNAMLLDLETGELLAMVSLNDFDPNLPSHSDIKNTFNRNTLGVYEPGSIFKVINTAIALNTGKATLNSVYDASAPLRIGRFKVTDFKGKYRPLNVREIFIYSSNIGSAKMALDFGGKIQQEYLKYFGFFETPTLEVPELGAPLFPKNWTNATTMTVAYGYGIAVSPLQSLIGIATVIRDGVKPDVTLLKQSFTRTNTHKKPIISPKISKLVCDLMRFVVTEGTGKKADVPGYEVFGKTGTAHKNKGKGYSEKARSTFFIGGFPYSSAIYMVFVMLDDPKASKAT
ncbi:MAG: penicillin-binding protein 2 [Proteobacteria bacterium]|nr:penicillin-binding protein 2 [Pseudomonadota bacterium]